MTYATGHYGLLIVCGGRDFTRRRIGHDRAIEIGLPTTDSTQSHPRRCEIWAFQAVAAHRDHRFECVFGLFEVTFLLEIERVGEQGRGEHLQVAIAVRFTCRAHDATEMRRLGPLA